MKQPQFVLILYLIFINTVCLCVIKDASYVIYHNADSSAKEYATFYSAEGERVGGFSYHQIKQEMRMQLDPHAHKPQPVSCKKIYWLSPSDAGYYLAFYDKNENEIRRYAYNPSDNTIIFGKDDYKIKIPFHDMRDLDYSLVEKDLAQLLECPNNNLGEARFSECCVQ